MFFLFSIATLISGLSFLLMSGAILPGIQLVGDAAILTFAGSSIIAVGSALAMDA